MALAVSFMGKDVKAQSHADKDWTSLGDWSSLPLHPTTHNQPLNNPFLDLERVRFLKPGPATNAFPHLAKSPNQTMVIK
jgi:hypothetical protein